MSPCSNPSRHLLFHSKSIILTMAFSIRSDHPASTPCWGRSFPRFTQLLRVLSQSSSLMTSLERTTLFPQVKQNPHALHLPCPPLLFFMSPPHHLSFSLLPPPSPHKNVRPMRGRTGLGSLSVHSTWTDHDWHRAGAQ